MLTGGLMPDRRVIELCHRALETGLPVLGSDANTYETAHMLANLSSAIPVDDPNRIEKAMEVVATRIDTDWLQQHLKVARQNRLSRPLSGISCRNAHGQQTSASYYRKAASHEPCRPLSSVINASWPGVP